MTSAVFDFKSIAKALTRAQAGESQPYCFRCDNGGWECYSTGHKDPHFRPCSSCGNPNNHPCP